MLSLSPVFVLKRNLGSSSPRALTDQRVANRARRSLDIKFEIIAATLPRNFDYTRLPRQRLFR